MLHLSVCFTHLYASPACVHFQCASWSFTWLCASSAWIPDFTWMCAWPVCMCHLPVCFTSSVHHLTVLFLPVCLTSPDCVCDVTWLCFLCVSDLSAHFSYLCVSPMCVKHPYQCILCVCFSCSSSVCAFHLYVCFTSLHQSVLHHICALYLSTCFIWLYASPVCVLNMSVSPVLMFYLSAYFICLCAPPGCVLHMCVCVCMCMHARACALSIFGCMLYLCVGVCFTCLYTPPASLLHLSVYILYPLFHFFWLPNNRNYCCQLLTENFGSFWNMLDCYIKMLHFFFYYYSVTLCLLPLDVCVSLPLSFSLICLNSSDFLCLPVCPMSLLLALSSPMFHTLTMAW